MSDYNCGFHGAAVQPNCPHCSRINERKDKARSVLIDYLRMKTDQCDWHGVSDAANDLRVLEAEIAAKGGKP